MVVIGWVHEHLVAATMKTHFWRTAIDDMYILHTPKLLLFSPSPSVDQIWVSVLVRRVHVHALASQVQQYLVVASALGHI